MFLFSLNILNFHFSQFKFFLRFKVPLNIQYSIMLYVFYTKVHVLYSKRFMFYDNVQILKYN